MERYSSYKDSGVDWLGEIPEHWEILKLKRIASMYSGNGFPISLQGHSSGEYPVYKAKNINRGNSVYLESSENYISSTVLIAHNFTLVPANSILFPKIGEAMRKNGRRISSSPCCLDNNCGALHIFNPNVIAHYFYYFMTTVDMSYMDNGGPIPSVNSKLLLSMLVSVPPLEEQRAIAAYLDDQCGKLDSAVEKLERAIELLQERKQIIISQAVTKGLDPNVPLKDSGVDWLGEIPEHWEVYRFKNFLTLKTKPSLESFKVGLENIESKTGRLVLSDSIFDGDGVAFCKGDILYGKLRPYLQKVWLADRAGNAVGDFFVYKVNNESFGKFVFYLMLSSKFTEVCSAATYGAKMPRVSSQFIGSLTYFLPPLEEQCAIAAYLDDQCGKIDALIEKRQRMIELLKERKQIIISDAVTGKIKVA